MAAAPPDWLPRDILAGNGDPHVVVALSGGVDSSVAILRIREAGLRCSALFMKNWNEPTEDGHCRWEQDVDDCLEVCEKLDVPLNTIDLSKAYWDGVFEDFLAEYRRGRTPNPDVLCNREIKFKAFLEAARKLGGDLIATGHYVRSDHVAGLWRLKTGVDANKDQSYFLYTLGQAQLGRSLFPVGDLPKREVRAMARAAGLVTHEKKDSTGICFIGERRFREFLAQYVPAQPGPVVTEDGRVIGQHHGAVYYTLGQRQGLGIGGVRGAIEAPWFVAAKDLEHNVLTVVQGHDHPALLSQALLATDLSWVAGEAPPLPYACTAKTRYRQRAQACTVLARHGDRLLVEFAAPQRAATPGQSVVFYQDEVCIGGGIIAEVAKHAKNLQL
ncbi:MAG: tRNA 2-thiouridine(34) synthase MnmA [Proteobacteria bacterium]|nr:tRNA 2-thiouridine(34) synthase MnmA [Pseudomonadota bacterium]